MRTHEGLAREIAWAARGPLGDRRYGLWLETARTCVGDCFERMSLSERSSAEAWAREAVGVGPGAKALATCLLVAPCRHGRFVNEEEGRFDAYCAAAGVVRPPTRS